MDFVESVNSVMRCYHLAERSFIGCINIMEQLGRALGMEIPRTHVITHELSPSLVVWMRIPEFCPPEIVMGLAVFGLIMLIACVGVPLAIALNFAYFSCLSRFCSRRRRGHDEPDHVEEPYTSGLTQTVIPTLAANDAAALANELHEHSPEALLERRVATRRNKRVAVRNIEYSR